MTLALSNGVSFTLQIYIPYASIFLYQLHTFQSKTKRYGTTSEVSRSTSKFRHTKSVNSSNFNRLNNQAQLIGLHVIVVLIFAFTQEISGFWALLHTGSSKVNTLMETIIPGYFNCFTQLAIALAIATRSYLANREDFQSSLTTSNVNDKRSNFKESSPPNPLTETRTRLTEWGETISYNNDEGNNQLLQSMGGIRNQMSRDLEHLEVQIAVNDTDNYNREELSNASTYQNVVEN